MSAAKKFLHLEKNDIVKYRTHVSKKKNNNFIILSYVLLEEFIDIKTKKKFISSLIF